MNCKIMQSFKGEKIENPKISEPVYNYEYSEYLFPITSEVPTGRIFS